MKRTRVIVVPIDGEPVRLQVAPYPIRAALALTALGPEPGPGAALSGEQMLAYLDAVGPLVSVTLGDVVFDGRPLTDGRELLMRFAARGDVLEGVRAAALSGQSVTPDGPRPTLQDIRIAVRFKAWLGDDRRVPSSAWMKTGASCSNCLAAGLSQQRGCDGTPQRSAVWNDGGDLVVRSCPVRSLTTEVEALQQLFYLTHHAVFAGTGLPYYDRHALPETGGVLDQDAWTMQALECVQAVHNARLLREFKRQQEERAHA